MDLFEYASRNKLRFPSPKGLLTVEDLWDLALQGLDVVAKGINRELKSTVEESFINTSTTNKKAAVLDIQLSIVKHIIATMQKEAQDKLLRDGRRAEKARLLEILETKENEKLLGMTPEQIRARIAELDAA